MHEQSARVARHCCARFNPSHRWARRVKSPISESARPDSYLILIAEFVIMAGTTWPTSLGSDANKWIVDYRTHLWHSGGALINGLRRKIVTSMYKNNVVQYLTGKLSIKF